MQTECARCHKPIDTVQGYKFGPNQYLCMPCYDQFKAERQAKAKQQHKNPLVEKFGNGDQSHKAAPGPAPLPQQKSPTPQPKSPPKPSPRPAMQPTTKEPAAAPPPPAGAEAAAKSSVETCDVCKKPLDGFKFPLKGGKKVCLNCNNIIRDVAKSLILNIQCPYCGKEIQLSQD